MKETQYQPFPLIPNISPDIAALSQMSNPFEYYEWLNNLNGPAHGSSGNLSPYLEKASQSFEKPWGVQGYFELPINPIDYKGLPVGIRIGYATIGTNERPTNQNYHIHPYTPEILFSCVVQGRASILYDNTLFPLQQGPNTVIIPPGIPHDIILDKNTTILTADIKTFDFTNRRDNLRRSDENINSNHSPLNTHLSPISQDPLWVDILSHGVWAIYNPNEEAIWELAQYGYNCGYLILLDPKRQKNCFHAVRMKTDAQLPRNSDLIPAIFIADFSLTP